MQSIEEGPTLAGFDHDRLAPASLGVHATPGFPRPVDCTNCNVRCETCVGLIGVF